MEPADFSEFAKTWKLFFAKNKFSSVYIEDKKFLKHYAKLLPNKVKVKIIKSKNKKD
jgi:7-cyano-7-deazaguanine tRNA-ribosyltransferase